MERGQINTLEAFIAALLIVGALIFASQATAVTPLSASTSNQHIENQQQRMAEDVLALAGDDERLHDALTYWNTTEEEADEDPRFQGANSDRVAYADLPPEDHPLHSLLFESFDRGVHAYNIDLLYRTPSNETAIQRKIHMGTPSDNAVRATRLVVLTESDTLSVDESETALADLDEDEFWAENQDESSELYVVVEVRITIWRM